MPDMPINVIEAVLRLKRMWAGENFDKIYPDNAYGYGEINDMRQVCKWAATIIDGLM